MQIAELERRSGLSRDTLRYYERMGLITPPRRADNGYRDYDPRTLVELAFIAKAQQVGFSLKQIRPAMAHVHAPPGHCAELLAGMRAKRDEVKARLAEDRQRLARLNKLIARLS